MKSRIHTTIARSFCFVLLCIINPVAPTLKREFKEFKEFKERIPIFPKFLIFPIFPKTTLPSELNLPRIAISRRK